MTPYEFLTQQVVNVEQALTETLRYEYGPAPDWGYYNECSDRLSRIKIAITGTSTTDTASIAARLDELADLSVWISFIERSRLGEFSWPFAEALRKMANALLSDRGLSGKPISPIVHIIADGEGYFIHPERTSASGNHKFAIIAFPRPLKHHVLLHSIFGHELGHSALHSVGAGTDLQNKVMTALQSAGPLHNENSITSWLRDNTAPPQVRDILDQYNADFGMQYEFPQEYLLDWLEELICDLFGLLLFGPGFAAAYRTYLRPMQANPYEVGLRNPTHPPYAVRHRMIVRTIQLNNWNLPITGQKPYKDAEEALLNYVLEDRYAPWATILSDTQLTSAISGVKDVLTTYGGLGYGQLDECTLVGLLERLNLRLPPIVASLSNRGTPELSEIDITHTLYAGWVYAIGNAALTSTPLSFLYVNKLCDYALLQQRAINIARAKGMK